MSNLKHKTFIENITHEGNKDLEKFDFKSIAEDVKKYNIAVIKNFVHYDEIEHCKNIIRNQFLSSNDNIRKKDEYFKTAENYQRLCVGYGSNPATGALSNPRLFRIFFNPTFKKDIYDLNSVFSKMIRFRNLLYGLNETFCLNGMEKGLFSASRVHQFPSGGGFLASHKDTDGAKNSSDSNLNTYMQPLLIFSQKGKDFKSGGGFIEYKDEIITYDDYLLQGDIAIYNGNTMHGVYNVDEDNLLDLTKYNGRSSLLVTLFKQP